jgi:1-acyl-sn-glycerol-3-phosphate acyltransferase
MNSWTMQPANDLELAESARWTSLNRESGLVSTLLHGATWGMIKSYLGLYHRLRIEGIENIPEKPPFVLVSNHTSHLDALVLGAVMPGQLRDRVFPIAAGDVFFCSAWRSAFAAKLLNALPMWRKRCGAHALQELRRRLLDEPCAYILFPEGCRSRNGRTQPFKNGIGMLVASADVPVVPCHIDGAFESLPPGRWAPVPRSITLRIGAPLRFDSVENDRLGWEQIAGTLRSAIEQIGEANTECQVRI